MQTSRNVIYFTVNDLPDALRQLQVKFTGTELAIFDPPGLLEE